MCPHTLCPICIRSTWASQRDVFKISLRRSGLGEPSILSSNQGNGPEMGTLDCPEMRTPDCMRRALLLLFGGCVPAHHGAAAAEDARRHQGALPGGRRTPRQAWCRRPGRSADGWLGAAALSMSGSFAEQQQHECSCNVQSRGIRKDLPSRARSRPCRSRRTPRQAWCRRPGRSADGQL